MSGWELQLYCADPGHLRQGEQRPREVKVARLEVLDGFVMPVAVFTGSPIARAWGDMNDAERALWHDQEPTVAATGSQVPPGRLDRRWRFECSLCQYTVVALDDRLYAVASKLRDAGVSALSLHGLASTLR